MFQVEKVEMIEIKNLTKKYGDVPVYNNFSLSIEEGKIIAILGESGSGKTTLLNCIAGTTAFEGDITKLKCSYVFQTPRLISNLTVKQNLKLVCGDEAKIDDILKKVRLYDRADSYPDSLSGGQAQRVSLARAFVYDSRIILMDEPFSSLDLRLKREIAELFISVWKEDARTAVFVTHDVDEALCIAHRIIVLEKGKTIYDVSPEGEPLRDITAAGKRRNELILKLL